MKAVVFDEPGGPDVLRYDDAPDPQPQQGEVLVRVRAAGINRAEVLQRRGAYPPPAGASPILGLELAGDVVQGAGEWQTGDRVMAVVTGGGYAELAAVPAGMLIPVPDGMGYDEAAAIPEAFLTAYLNLFTLGGLHAGETVLVHAGASGVGTAAIQLAHAAGARVITTAGSDEKLQRCAALGADVLINYRREAFQQRVKDATDGAGAHLILDFIGAPYWEANMAALATNGRLMLIGFLGGSAGNLDLGPILAKSLRVSGTTLRRTPLAQKTQLVRDFCAFALPRFASGELKPVLDTVFPADQAASAHRMMESNSNTGKIVLRFAE